MCVVMGGREDVWEGNFSSLNWFADLAIFGSFGSHPGLVFPESYLQYLLPKTRHLNTLPTVIMEDLIERISSGENMTIILGYSSHSNTNTTSNTSHIYQQYLSILLQMKRLYCNLHIILFHYDNNHTMNLSHSSSNSNSFPSSGKCKKLLITI